MNAPLTPQAALAADALAPRRVFNFSPGPSTMPQSVLEQAAAEMLDYRGCGVSVLEMSHRSAAFEDILARAEQDLRDLLAIPAAFKVLFMQGGAIGQNAIVPMNLVARRPGRAIDVVVTGEWSRKSWTEAQRYGDVALAASTLGAAHDHIPDPAGWALRQDASYVHLCSNETVHGVEFQTLPDLRALGSEAPLVVDASSNIASRTIDWTRAALVFAGAQKNLGPSGITVVIVREDLLGHALPTCPSVFDYRVTAEQRSMLNTPPTYPIYLLGLMLQWLKGEGGVPAIEQRNRAKSDRLYAAIDGSGGFYRNPVAPADRSRMNVPFVMPSEALTDRFVAEAEAAGLSSLRGHKSVGGLRASIYNAMPEAGVEALVAFMHDFQRRHG